MKPIEVNSQNEQKLLDTVYNYKLMYTPIRRAVFKVGDYVRVSEYRAVFDKSYTPNWTTTIFTIRKVQYNTDPITYLLRDSFYGTDIEGSMYAEELQPVKYPNEYIVEKVLKKRNGRVYVKWLGFDSSHNSWIPEGDLKN